MITVSKIMRNQLLSEAMLERSGFKAPAGYFDQIHFTLDVLDKHGDRFTQEMLDSVSYKTSHPYRNLAVSLTPVQALFSRSSAEESAYLASTIVRYLADPTVPFDVISAFLITNSDEVRVLVEGRHAIMSNDKVAGAAANTGFISNILGPHRFYLLGKPTFLMEQKLCEGLIQTSFGMDTPSSFLRSPLPYCYIEFGTERNLDVHVYNDSSGLHQVEGVYLSEYIWDSRTKSDLLDFLEERGAASRDSDSLRYIELEFTGSPIGKSMVLDDATFNISMMVDDNACLTIEKLYELHVEYFQGRFGVNDVFESSAMNEQTALCFMPLLELLIKSLIFINSDLSVRRSMLERKELEKQLAGLKNKAKQRKLLRKVANAKDYILISSKAPLEYSAGAGTGGLSKSTHWRRGHFRNQRFGEALSNVKVVWIQPTLVGLGQAQPKLYRVTS